MALANGCRGMFEQRVAVLEQPQTEAVTRQLEPEVELPPAKVSSSPLRAFAHRDFALLCAGAAVSNVGTWMERVAVGVWVTETTGQAAWTGLVTAMLFLPVAVLGPLGGALSDRANRRQWLLRVTVAQAVVAGLLALLASLHRLDVTVMSVLMFLTGCTSVLLSAGFNAVLAEIVPARDLTSAMFLNSGQWNLARIVGPLLAAPVIAFGSPALAFWLNTASFVAVIVVVLRMKIPERAVNVKHEPLREGLLNGFRAVRDDAGIFSALCITGLAGFFIAPFIGLVPVFALQTLHEGPAAASLLVAAQGVGAVIAALTSAALLDRVGAGRWLKWTCGALAVLATALWVAPTLGWALAAMVLLGAAYLSVITSSSRVCLGRAPAGAQARVASLFHSVLDTTYAVGLIAAGAVADLVGLRQVGVAMVVLFVAAIWALGRSRRHLFTSLG
jgi:MFS family permease